MRELSPRKRARLWLRMGIRLALTLLTLWGIFRLGPLLISLFAPFLLALLTAWTLSPTVGWLHKKLDWPRKLFTPILLFLAFGLVFAFLWGLAVGVAKEILQLAGNWDALLASLQNAMDALGTGLSRLTDLLPPSARAAVDALSVQLFQWLHTAIPRLLSRAADALANAVRGLPSFAVAIIVFILAACFLTSDWPSLRARAVGCLPEGPRFLLSQIRRALSAGFGGYVKAQLILSAGVFLILLVGFLFIREAYAILLAFVLAVLDFIPIVGAGTAMLPWALLELLTGSPRRGLEVLAVWGVVALFRRIAEPRVLGSQTGLPPIASLMSVYAGMRLAGVWGMIAAPVVCLAALNVTRAGVLDHVWHDLRMAAGDLAALLDTDDPDEPNF